MNTTKLQYKREFIQTRSTRRAQTSAKASHLVCIQFSGVYVVLKVILASYIVLFILFFLFCNFFSVFFLCDHFITFSFMCFYCTHCTIL